MEVRAEIPKSLDLLALFCGSEGLLGVVTEIWVRLLPKPPERRVLLAAFPTVEGAAESVAAIIGRGLIPAGLEMMDTPAIRAAEAFVEAGYPTDAGAILLCELDGVPAEVESDTAMVVRVFEEFGADRCADRQQ